MAHLPKHLQKCQVTCSALKAVDGNNKVKYVTFLSMFRQTSDSYKKERAINNVLKIRTD